MLSSSDVVRPCFAQQLAMFRDVWQRTMLLEKVDHLVLGSHTESRGEGFHRRKLDCTEPAEEATLCRIPVALQGIYEQARVEEGQQDQQDMDV